GVDFEVAPGEIHALLGENGAGKSTLMNVLSGLTPPDRGEIQVEGEPVRRDRHQPPADRIAMVHQHHMLVENFTVEENLRLALGTGPRRAQADSVARELGWPFKPRTLVADQPLGSRQRLEIVKALARRPAVLIL